MYTIDFDETENHHANRTDDSHYEDFWIVSKKRDLGRYDPKHPWRNRQWPFDLEWNQEDWNYQELLWCELPLIGIDQDPKEFVFDAQMQVTLDEVPYKSVEKDHLLCRAASQGDT